MSSDTARARGLGATCRASADAAAFWSALFGNHAPVEIEIGSGDGSFLIAAARRAPATNFLGIERSPAKFRRLAARVAQLDPRRIRILRADACCVLHTIVPVASVSAYHVYFPDPWPKRRHARRRLFTRALVAVLGDGLMPGGSLFTATDVEAYAQRIRAVVLADRRFEERACGVDHPGLATAFARKYRAAGRMIYPAVFVRRTELA